MSFAPFLLAAMLAVASPSPSTSPADSHVATPNTPATAPTPDSPGLLAIGEPAPNFEYQSHDYLWQRFHNMLEQGAVVLVFAPDDAALRSLEHDRDAMLARGVLPVAVVERRDGDVWKIVRRLDLTYSLLADPRGTIASQFGAWDERARRPLAAWYVIAPDGRVRASGAGALPHDGIASTAFAALGLPSAAAARPASTR